VDDIERAIVEAAQTVEQLQRQLSALLGGVSSADERLAGELTAIVDSMTATATHLTGIASRWHYVER
jgi:ABC-type transporter Mla subunit MlaD